MTTRTRRAILATAILAILVLAASVAIAQTAVADLQQAKRFVAAGNYDSAVPLLKSLAAGNGSAAAEALMMLGTYYSTTAEDIHSAIESHKAGLLKLGDMRGKLYFDLKTCLASALAISGDADAALDVLKAVSIEYGDTIPLWRYWTGRCYLLKGDKDGARAIFREIISEHPRNPIALNASLNLARLLIGDGSKAEGMAVLDDYLAGHPSTEPQVVMWKGDMLFQNGDYAGAIPCLQAALKFPRYSGNRDVRWELSVALCRAGRVDEGIEQSKLMLSPQDTGNQLAMHLVFCGDCYDGAARYPEAIKAYVAALKVAGISAQSKGYLMFTLAETHSRAGNPDKSTALLKRLVAEQGVESKWGKIANDRLHPVAPASK